MTIFITGATGFIGRHVMATLAANGFEVKGLTRQATSAPNHIQVDYENLGDVFQGATWVLHFADEAARGADAHMSDRLAKAIVEAAPEGAKLMFTSSVYARIDTAPESYGAKKRRAEAVFLNARPDTIILRLPPVYGRGAKGGMATLQKLVKSGLPLPFGRATAPRDYLYVENLAALVVHILKNPDRAHGSIIEPCDGAPKSTRDLCKEMANIMGKNARLLPVPLSVLSLLGRLTGKAAMIDAAISPLRIVNSQDVHEVLGWSPGYHMPQSLHYLKD